ncbi:MAG: hypothetical protein PHE53_06630 [Thermoguttaceae bacterium]|nr:hypothetical protein [Thermoguttaceae bacterium]
MAFSTKQESVSTAHSPSESETASSETTPMTTQTPPTPRLTRCTPPPVPPAGRHLLHAVKLMLFGLAAALIIIPWTQIFSILFVICSLIPAVLSLQADGATRLSRRLAILITLFDLGILFWTVRAIAHLF